MLNKKGEIARPIPPVYLPPPIRDAEFEDQDAASAPYQTAAEAGYSADSSPCNTDHKNVTMSDIKKHSRLYYFLEGILRGNLASTLAPPSSTEAFIEALQKALLQWSTDLSTETYSCLGETKREHWTARKIRGEVMLYDAKVELYNTLVNIIEQSWPWDDETAEDTINRLNTLMGLKIMFYERKAMLLDRFDAAIQETFDRDADTEGNREFLAKSGLYNSSTYRNVLQRERAAIAAMTMLRMPANRRLNPVRKLKYTEQYPIDSAAFYDFWEVRFLEDDMLASLFMPFSAILHLPACMADPICRGFMTRIACSLAHFTWARQGCRLDENEVFHVKEVRNKLGENIKLPIDYKDPFLHIRAIVQHFKPSFEHVYVLLKPLGPEDRKRKRQRPVGIFSPNKMINTGQASRRRRERTT